MSTQLNSKVFNGAENIPINISKNNLMMKDIYNMIRTNNNKYTFIKCLNANDIDKFIMEYKKFLVNSNDDKFNDFLLGQINLHDYKLILSKTLLTTNYDIYVSEFKNTKHNWFLSKKKHSFIYNSTIGSGYSNTQLLIQNDSVTKAGLMLFTKPNIKYTNDEFIIFH